MNPQTSTPVTALVPFTLQAGVITEPQVIPIYTLSSGVPERIESIYFTVTYPDNNATNNVLVIQFEDPSGLIVFEQASPALKALDDADLEVHCNWSRLGNDSSQAPLFIVKQANDNVSRAWFNMRLPETVLIATSVVNLLNYVDDGGESFQPVVTDATITVARDVGAPATTSALDFPPILLPQATS